MACSGGRSGCGGCEQFDPCLSPNRLAGAMALPLRSTACYQPTVVDRIDAHHVWPDE
jgi:hypothetical protein